MNIIKKATKNVAIAIALFASWGIAAAQAQQPSPSEETPTIAKEACIYGFSMVDHYRIEYSYFQDKNGPNHKSPWNQLINIPRAYTPEDTTIQTPNSDTPCSFIGMDLPAEPMVLTVPKINKNRYLTVQLLDAYTHNFAYIDSRVTGNGCGSYLIAGPNLKGETPKLMKTGYRNKNQSRSIG